MIPFQFALKERTERQINQLHMLSLMIPQITNQKHNLQKIFMEIINVNGYKHQRANNLNIQKRKRELLEKGFIPTQKTDPAEQFLIRAIINKQSWESIIKRYNMSALFVQLKDDWSRYQQWIIFLCFQGWDPNLALYLSSTITKRAQKSIQTQIKSLNMPYYNHKFLKWRDKDITQLQLIHYQLERTLLISIKLKKSFQEIATQLNLEKMLNSPVCALQYQRYYWIAFLCARFQDNKSIVMPSHVRGNQRLVWKKCKLNFKHNLQYSLKLDRILKLTKFEQHFTNQIEVCLLEHIKSQSTWKQTKKSIEKIFQDVKSNKIYKHNNKQKIIANNEDDQVPTITDAVTQLTQQNFFRSYQKAQESMSQSSDRSTSKIDRQKNQRTIPNKIPLYQYSFQGDNNLQAHDKVSFTAYFSNKNETPPPKIKSPQLGPSLKEQKKAKSHSKAKQKILEPTNTTSSKTMHNQKLTINKPTKSNRMVQNEIEPRTPRLNLSSQQKLMISLIKNLKGTMDSFEKNYFEGISRQNLQSFYKANKEIIQPMHQSILSIYRKDRALINQITNKSIKKMIQVNLALEDSADNQDQKSRKPQQTQSQQIRDKEHANIFVSGFNKLVADMVSKKIDNQQGNMQQTASPFNYRKKNR